MTMAVATETVRLTAVDCRWTWDRIGNEKVEAWHEDHGFKLRRAEGAWIAATGSARLSALSLRRLVQCGVDSAQAAQGAFDAALEETRQCCSDIDLTHIFIVRDQGDITVLSTDPNDARTIPPPGPGQIRLQTSWPPGLPVDGGAVQARLAERIVRATDPGGVIRCVVQAFVEAYEHADGSMSSKIEIGITAPTGHFGHLRCEAADIKPDVKLKFGPPPVLPPFPEAPFERRLFGFEVNVA